MYGYCGKLLRVDLDTGNLHSEDLDARAARRFIGGSGLAAHYFFAEVAPVMERADKGGAGTHPDPLGPDNPLIIMTGPVTGSRLPAAARWTVSARSPLTGIWGESNSGGSFGAELKFAGFDGVIITGRAVKPTYLLIEAGKASLQPADDLWGKDTYEVTDLLAARHGKGDTGGGADGGGAEPEGSAGPAKVLCIGPAGESLVRFACACHDKYHFAGRTGMGAVMGSKNLKAVVVRGEGRSPAAADPDGLKELTKRMRDRFAENMVAITLREAGTLASLDLGGLVGDIPLRNWSLGSWRGLEKLSVAGYAEHVTGQATCFACPVGCFRKVSLQGFGRVLEGTPGATYETVAMLGANLLIDDLCALQVAGEVCNRLGLDTISAGSVVAYAYEAAEKGLLDKFPGADCLKDGWGDGPRLIGLLEDIAYRRGIGGELAEGSEALSRKIGRPEAKEFLVTVKGLELPAHDPRAAHGAGIQYATANRGGCHLSSMMFNLEYTGFAAPEAGLDYDGNQQSSKGKGFLNKAAEDLGCVLGQAAILCHLGGTIYTPGDLLSALNSVTGFGLTMDDMMECGARIWHLKRGIDNLYGVTSADDRLPSRLLQALDDGGAAGSVPDMDLMLAEWREARGLDAGGRAKREVLEGLGLGRLADLIEAKATCLEAGD